jgi:hypothetical protein
MGEIELEQQAFLFGNIKPDLPSPTRVHHTMENCLSTVLDLADYLMTEEVQLEKFSVTLGEICHYVSDFFCYHHLNEELHNKKLKHVLYEFKLHYELYRLHFTRKITMITIGLVSQENIESIIRSMREDYFLQPVTLRRDLDFAFMTAAIICKAIQYHKSLPNLEDESNLIMESFMYS